MRRNILRCGRPKKTWSSTPWPSTGRWRRPGIGFGSMTRQTTGTPEPALQRPTSPGCADYLGAVGFRDRGLPSQFGMSRCSTDLLSFAKSFRLLGPGMPRAFFQLKRLSMLGAGGKMVVRRFDLQLAGALQVQLKRAQ